MASGPYSFIDIAVLHGIRERFAVGDTLVVLSTSLDEVIWANGAGATLLGYQDVEAVMGASPGLAMATRRQIAAAPGFPLIATERPVAVRLAGQIVQFQISAITLPDGAPAVLLALPSRGQASSGATHIIDGLGQVDHFAALLDEHGQLQSASAGFNDLSIPQDSLTQLVNDVALEEDRLVKRLIPADGRLLPAGIARLTDHPALHLLIAIDAPVELSASELDAARDDIDAEAELDMATPPVETSFETGAGIEELAIAPDLPPSVTLTLDVPDAEETDDHDWVEPSDADLPERIDEDLAEFPDVSAPQAQAVGEFIDAIEDAAADAPTGQTEPPPETATVSVEKPDLASDPVRFSWRTDASGAFSAISDEFVQAVGSEAASIVGRSFRDVASAFALDPDGEIAGLLERRDTWSGRSVLWPIAGTDLLAPVDLAALPAYNRDRVFEGFRGFGVARMGDVIVDPEARGLRLWQEAPAPGAPDEISETGAATPQEEPTASDAAEDPFRGEKPAIAFSEPQAQADAENVIRLDQRRTPPAGENRLSPVERNAFEQIRARLSEDHPADSRDPAALAPIEADQESPAVAEAEPAGELVAPVTEDHVISLPATDEPLLPESVTVFDEPATETPAEREPWFLEDDAATFEGFSPTTEFDSIATDASAFDEPTDISEPITDNTDLNEPSAALLSNESDLTAQQDWERVAVEEDFALDGSQAVDNSLQETTEVVTFEDEAEVFPPVANAHDRDDAWTAQAVSENDAQLLDLDAEAEAAIEGRIQRPPSRLVETHLNDPERVVGPHPGSLLDVQIGEREDERPLTLATDEPADPEDTADATGWHAISEPEERQSTDASDNSDWQERTGSETPLTHSLSLVDESSAATAHERQPTLAVDAPADPEDRVDAAGWHAVSEPGEHQLTDASDNIEGWEGTDSETSLTHSLSLVDESSAASAPEQHEHPSTLAVDVPADPEDTTDAAGWHAVSGPDERQLTDASDNSDGQEGADSDTLPAHSLPIADESVVASATDQREPAVPATAAAQETPALDDGGYMPSAFAAEPKRIEVDPDLIAGLPLPLLVHAGDELYFANREFLALTGYEDIEHLIEAGGLDALFAERASESTTGPEGSKLYLRHADGTEFAVGAHLQSIRWRGSSALLLALRREGSTPEREIPVAQDIKETAVSSVHSDADIEELERRVAEMRTIIDTATDGVVLIDNDGLIRNISRPAEALFGFDSATVEGKPFASLFATESQRAARDYLNGLTDNGVASVLNDGREVIGREAHGRFIPLFMTIGRLPGPGGFCAVVRDITQWKRAEEELTQARAHAERASSQKTEFLARVSHEIRTPLNAIIGFSELMVDEKFGPIASDRYRDYLRDINRSGNHVLDLVNDLLDISKIEAGELDMSYEAVSLNDTLSESVAMMQPQANRERVIIRSSFASRLPEVVADLRSVRQIALNLLSNAIRYTPAGGQVIVSTVYDQSGDVVMRVRDTGIGMTLSEIDQAMKPFKQINALKRPRNGGTGLGLPLTKAMVEANRARFSISSTPGEGTMVEITFPSTRVLAD